MIREEIPGIIPKSEYIDELEDKVKFFVANAIKPKKVSNIIHSRVTVEDFKNPTEQVMWELDEIRKCKEGHAGMSPKMYFYFNYCAQLNITGGKIYPDYRVSQDDYMDFLQETQNSREFGVIAVKRRRWGASWVAAADVLHDVIFNKFFRVGMNSKTETDSIELFRKVKFIYDNLPQFLRVRTTAGNSKMSMDFSYYIKDSEGNRIRRGNQSEIIVKAPVATAFEGQMFNKWICDEAGKIPVLPQLWSYTEDCLMENTVRAGVPFIFGTSGDIGKEGYGMRKMWQNAEAHKLKRYFLPGYSGLIIDEFGNDLQEEAIRWIVYQRKLMENVGPKLYNDFLQKYPLTVEEAFSIANTGGVGNIVLINKQIQSLIEDPPVIKRGTFVLDSNGEVFFKQDPKNGKVIMYEDVIPGLKNGYNFGCDPADHDDVSNEASDLSLIGMRKQYGTKPPQIILNYTDRPKKVNDYFEQSSLALIYYNKSKVMIERNRYAMISYFQEKGLKYLLSSSPRGIMTMLNGRPTNTIGVTTTDAVKEYIEVLISEYIEEYWDLIPDEELLNQCRKWGAENTDMVMAWGMCLIQAKDDTNKIKFRGEKDKTLVLPTYQSVNGRIVRIRP